MYSLSYSLLQTVEQIASPAKKQAALHSIVQEIRSGWSGKVGETCFESALDSANCRSSTELGLKG